MKRLFLFFLLSILLASCASPAPNATITPLPTASATFTPPPTQTLTSAPTPTEIPDPNAPPDMTGVTREKNSEGGYDYFRTSESGEKEKWMVFMDGETKTISGWFTNGIENPMDNGGTYFMDAPKSNFDPLFSLEIYVNEDVENAPQLLHDRINTTSTGSAFTSDFMIRLMEKYSGKTQNKLVSDGDFPGQFRQFKKDLYEGRITFGVSDGLGNEGTITNQTRTKIFLVQPMDFTPQVDSKYSQYSKHFVLDDEGDIQEIVIIFAFKPSQPLESISPMDFCGSILHPFFELISINEAGVSQLVRSSVQGVNRLFEVKRKTVVSP